jgi:hypothetical protein
MFKVFFTTLKWALFAFAVLVLGNWIHWDQVSLSDHCKRLFPAPPETGDIVKTLKQWSTRVSLDSKIGAQKKGLNPYTRV